MPDTSRWAFALVILVAGAALAGAYLLGPDPAESRNDSLDRAEPAREPAPTPAPAPTPNPMGTAEAPASSAAPGEAWAVFARTLGASGLLNVSLESFEDGVAVVSFTEVDAAGGETSWRERIRVATREVLSSTNPRPAHAVPGYDAASGDATWLFIPNGSQPGDEVRVVDRAFTLEAGPSGTLRACGDVGGPDFEAPACYQYDPASGAYLAWSSDAQPGWSLVEASPTVEARLPPPRR